MPSRAKTCKIIVKFLAARSVLDKKKSEKYVLATQKNMKILKHD